MKQRSCSALVFEVIYTLTVIAFFAFGITNILSGYGCSDTVSILLATGIWALASFLFLILALLVKKKQINEWRIWHYPAFYPMITACYMIGTVVFRIVRICRVSWVLSGDLKLFHQAQVLENGSSLPAFWTNPFDFLTSVLMNLSMRVFGNCEEAVAFLFLLIQIITLFILLCAVRKIWGKDISLISLILLSFIPAFSDSIFCVSRIHILFLFMALVLLLISCLIKKGEKKIAVWNWILFGLLHILIGFGISFEMIFISILLMETGFILCSKTEPDNRKGVWVRAAIGILGGTAGFFLSFLLRLIDTEQSYLTSLREYVNGLQSSFSINIDAIVPDQYHVIGLCIGILMICYVVRSARKMNQQIISAYIFALINAVLILFHVTDEIYYGVVIFSYAIMASVSVSMLWRKENMSYEELEPEMDLRLDKTETATATEAAASTETTTSTESAAAPEIQTEARKVKLLDNPLPLPKKHVKKELDFAVQVEADKMHYDLEITDQDDYDI